MKAYELLSKPGAWTQGAGAKVRDDNDDLVDAESIYDPRACAWCAWGALKMCYRNPSDYVRASETLQRKIQPGYGGSVVGDIAWWNDAPNRTQEEVVATLKELDI